ncbi:TetR/AcrR family transcriptional regulator [Cryobacterium psychrophilum]|uniref:TetR/AcrR family transcriptional regulator n=1 Tax=Cryobacterium psychrophilum TaxID=41988 RepID=A0A4Y8KKL8_9MICO|nr:TetR/AcrR family transcriptional regulator [Cryobacterium psychrophilum]TDW28429.1 TetR family transcriptional regulator [Cryobacterium psychrophilum]TFD75109.1 TetR/AcrR family transcriptional regulator [Cryobacterium psychrophilum]
MARRERGSARPSGDERQDAILATAESLLAHRSLGDISIEDLARGAGISRPSFYSYFSSKQEVVIALLTRVIDEVEQALSTLPAEPASAAGDPWRSSISVFVDVFTKHEAVAATAMAARLHSPEIQALWAAAMESWVDYSARAITSERKRGAAPDGIPARDLAVALNLMNERVLSASSAGEQPAISPSSVVDVLASIWTLSIYGAPPEATTSTAELPRAYSTAVIDN